MSRRYNLPRVRISTIREGTAPFDAPPTASTADDAANVVGLKLLDHVVVGEPGRHVSFYEAGLLDPST